MKKLVKRISRNIITFEMGDDNEVVALAKLGLSNKCIRKRIKGRKSDGQITYRLSKAKKAEGNPTGYRFAYRNGESDIAMLIINDLAGVMREEVRRNVTPKITHPTPVTVKI